MNPAHLHLMLTHVPLCGPAFGLLFLLAGTLQRSRELQRAGLLLFLLSGICVLPIYLTGRPASALLMKAIPTASMSMDIQDQHAEVAIIALVSALLLGLVSAAA